MTEEIDIEYAMRALSLAKIFYDHNCLDRLLEAAGADTTISEDELCDLERAAAERVFADTRWAWQEGKWDYRCRGYRAGCEVYVFRDPLLTRYDRLCRSYETAKGCSMAENPFAKMLDRVIQTHMQLDSYCHEFYWKPGDGGRRDARLVLLLSEEFYVFCNIPGALFAILDFCQEDIPSLEAALAEASGEMAALQPTPGDCRKEAA